MKDYTKDLLCETIIDMMKSKSIEKIRVSDLCKVCQIERSTFYYHFKDKYDLLTYVYLRDFKNIDITDYKQTASVLSKMRSQIHFYQNAYKDFPDNFFLNYMRSYYYDAFYKVIEHNMYPNEVPANICFELKLYLSGGTSMTKDWVFASNTISADEFARLLYDAIPEAVKKVFFVSGKPLVP